MDDWVQETRREVEITDKLAREEKFVDQPVLTIYTVHIVICKYIVYANLYQHI